MTMTNDRNSKVIAELNDQFRKGDMSLGQWMISPGIQALRPQKQARLIEMMKAYNDFTPDDDPYREHDFGILGLDGERYYWKIDYYDKDYTYHSSDPASPNATKRILTLMRADEY